MDLYVSDLDGTLLDKNAQVSEYTSATLNELISNGMDFTVATARTNATVSKILSGLTLRLPVILMNGVLIYDNIKGRYIFRAVIPKDIVCGKIKHFTVKVFARSSDVHRCQQYKCYE